MALRWRCLALALSLALWPAAAGAAGEPDGAVDVLAHYLRAVDQRATGDLDGAVRSLEAARALAPDDADLALELARTYAADRLWADAAAAYEEAGVIAPGRADLALAQARFHLSHAFRVRRAVAAAERALRLRPGDPEVTALRDAAKIAAALRAVD